MYIHKFPFKDLNGKPHNQEVAFNLYVHEIIKLMPEFQVVHDWVQSMEGPARTLSTEEVVRFYNAFESILLEAWGEKSEDGMHFRKGDRYDFEESALFAAVMSEFVSNPDETNRMLEALVPEGLDEVIAKANANIDTIMDNPDSPEALKAEIARLRAQNEGANLSAVPSSSSSE